MWCWFRWMLEQIVDVVRVCSYMCCILIASSE